MSELTSINIKLFEAVGEGHRAWVDQCQPGGPDITAQGATPEIALYNLASAISLERQFRRSLADVPQW